MLGSTDNMQPFTASEWGRRFVCKLRHEQSLLIVVSI